MPPSSLVSMLRDLAVRIARAPMRLFAAPRLDMQEDYEKVRRLQKALAARPLPLPRYRVLDREILSEGADAHAIPVRLFHPKEPLREDVILFFHGGGWVTGDIDSYTPTCLTMADLTGCTVAAVDYRLAPEHPFPAGLEDCARVARVLLDEPQRLDLVDPDRIVLVGDSAGGNLTAAVSLLLQAQGRRGAARQILLYPVTQVDHDPATSPFDSVRSQGEDHRLTSTEMQDYLEMYAPDPEDRRNPLVAPLLADDLHGQPRTLVLTAALDLLRDEGEAYGQALADAGTPVEVHRVERALHGFIALPRFARPLREAYEHINAFLDATAEDPAAGREGP